MAQPTPSAPVPAREALDTAYLKLASFAPEFGPESLSNHGPMTVEALSELGRADAIAPWLQKYVSQLEPQSSSPQGSETSETRHPQPPAEALGDFGQLGAWLAYFEQQLAGPKPQAVIDHWVAQLAPGVSAALGHGLLRTAHAARALNREPNATRRHELAQGLAYWASRYQELGAQPAVDSQTPVTHSAATQSAAKALNALPRFAGQLPEASLQQTLLLVSQKPEFNQVAVRFAGGENLSESLSDLVSCLAHLYSTNIDHEEPLDAASKTEDLAYVHAITATSAVRLVASGLSPSTQQLLLSHVWTFCAAVYSAYSHLSLADEGVSEPPEPEPGVGEVGGRFGELIDEAILGADEHGIKFTEVCVREVRAGGSRELLVLSRLVVARLVVAELKRKRQEKRRRKQG